MLNVWSSLMSRTNFKIVWDKMVGTLKKIGPIPCILGSNLLSKTEKRRIGSTSSLTVN